LIKHSPICLTCNDTGAVTRSGGVDACPDCALAAEQQWRMALEVSEQMQAATARKAQRRGKPMGKAA